VWGTGVFVFERGVFCFSRGGVWVFFFCFFLGGGRGGIIFFFLIIKKGGGGGGGGLNKGKQQMAENKSELNGEHMVLNEVCSECTASQPCSTS